MSARRTRAPAPTEARQRASRDLDRRSTPALLRLLWNEEKAHVRAVGRALPALGRAVTAAARRFADGGRVIYVGAGTSGRLGALDAAECPPTFGVPPQRFVALMAGGAGAFGRAREGAEDDAAAGRRELSALRPRPSDVVVGISASGATPYTLGALQEARRRGALTVAMVCAPDSPMAAAAEIAVVAPTGAEVLAGSTRLKAGSAQKALLNFFSTALMTRSGGVYDNLMVGVQPRNAKLRARAARILSQVGEVPAAAASRRLADAGGNLKVAIVMARLRCTRAAAEEALRHARGDLRQVLETRTRKARTRT